MSLDNKINENEENELWVLLADMDVVSHFVFLEHVNRSWTWEDFYPEWIDEEEDNEVPQCPSVPIPELNTNTTFHVLFAEMPCNISSDWTRDVIRLHIQLAIANIAVRSESSYVILFSQCPPFPNLFTCTELLLHRRHLWLYSVDAPKLQRKLKLPSGSCELAIKSKVQSYNDGLSVSKHRNEAYATILHSTWEGRGYVCGAIALGHSIRKTGSTRDMVIVVVDEEGSSKTSEMGTDLPWWEHEHYRHGLVEAGWRIISMAGIRNPYAQPNSYNEWNYSKLRLWQLTSYQKIVFLDSDTLVLRNIDFLFEAEELSASGNSRTVFNSGVMVIEPNNCTFNLLMSSLHSIVSYNGGDQGFLNEIFTWWHRLPRRTNFLKHFYSDSQEEFEQKTKLFGMDPPLLYVLHFLGYKPWLCFRDYDCSWNFPELRMFASDVAHATWWNVYDSMPHKLQQYCRLTRTQTDNLSFEIYTAKISLDPDPHRHWERNISDPRFLSPS
ncbi:hypothetical protein KP509_39G020600 [Ceratopteris richardii]|nr:hypothetical protein KP509_39G020600 [Ceratopteris richardii]